MNPTREPEAVPLGSILNAPSCSSYALNGFGWNPSMTSNFEQWTVIDDRPSISQAARQQGDAPR
jgi:hypothetical protein